MPRRRRAFRSKTRRSSSAPAAIGRVSSRPPHKRTPPSALQNSQSTPSTSRTPPSALQNSQSTPSTSRTPPSALLNSQSTPSTSLTLSSTLQSSQSPPTSLSKYLTLPQTTPSIKNKQPPRARLLTSASAVELMLEKERKSKKKQS